MPMWKQVASKELEERGQHADLNGLISGYGDPAKVGYMRRKCFYSYEKLLSTQATLELKVKKAIDAQAQALSEASRQNSENISARNDARQPATAQASERRNRDVVQLQSQLHLPSL